MVKLAVLNVHKVQSAIQMFSDPHKWERTETARSPSTGLALCLFHKSRISLISLTNDSTVELILPPGSGQMGLAL